MPFNFSFAPILSVCMALVLVSAAPAQAHRNWLLPSSTQVDQKDPWVTIDAAVAENLFEFDATALKLEGLHITGPDGQAVAAQNASTGKLRSTFDVQLTQPGTYRVSVITTPLMVSYQLDGTMRRWRGAAADLAANVPAEAQNVRRTQLHQRVETFVSAGQPNLSAIKPQGEGLEMMPLSNPTELFVGESTRFQWLLDGKPIAHLPISVVPGGVRYRGVLNEQRLVTDDQGRIQIKWTSPGRYWIGANDPSSVDKSEAPPARRVSYSATLEVLPN